MTSLTPGGLVLGVFCTPLAYLSWYWLGFANSVLIRLHLGGVLHTTFLSFFTPGCFAPQFLIPLHTGVFCTPLDYPSDMRGELTIEHGIDSEAIAEEALRRAGWLVETKAQDERIGIESDPESEEYERDPKAFLERYHEAVLDRAMHRPDMCAISPHALKDTPRAMKIHLPDGSRFSLKPHQLTGVGEMKHLETQEPYGGILADDMGLGKTLQMMALICRSKYEAGLVGNQICNLIVTPNSLISMWREQLAKTKPPKLEVITYHGPDKEFLTSEVLKEYDVVLTTYDVVRQQYKDHQAINDVKIARARNQPLPKIPPVTRQHVPLMTIDWGRLVLEEAHQARNTRTETFKAVHFLKTRRRWAITDTPFINDYTDVHSLLKFLRLKPWCVDALFHEYFVKPKKGRRSSELLMTLSNKALMAGFQSLAVRRERGSLFDGKPITETQEPVIE